MSDKKYYCNYPCKVLAELSNSKCVIELCTQVHSYDGGYQEPDYSEPEFNTIIVDKIYIADTKTDLEKEFTDASNKINKEKNAVLQEVREQKQIVEKEIKELRDRVKKYSGLDQMLDYLDGKIKWVICTDGYRLGIKELDKIFCGVDSTELASVSFRSKRRKDIHKTDIAMYLGVYSDDSGQKYEVKGFYDLDSAKQYFIENVSKYMKDYPGTCLKTCEEFGLDIPEVTAYKEKITAQKEEEKLKNIKKIEAELVALKESI